MEEYNIAMKKMMRNPYEYHHDLGMNYTPITDNLIVGSQPQKPEDIDHLKQEEKVAYVLNLQQDKDVEYWGIDLQSIIKRCQELGIRHMRRPARDLIQILCAVDYQKLLFHWNGPSPREKEKFMCTAPLG
ncbi:Phosphoglucan phosphatase LSF2, chloroplastic [Morella rubra]|uniref:Phosphoglucan phosphatase LSF2, chloroplastic n=1 Tax=Morella rubra TaxID=262757 RepID=A0A6A1W0F4_9ROSI|nr:Phosphoglucan phosphatase LSF2, chloroplastic [Morella rubra]